MGLPMYSPSLPKRQLPSKQPTSPPYTPEDFEEPYQNSRTSAFDIPEPHSESPQRSQRSSRRSTLPPYNLVQHIQRLHQLQQLHRTRTQQSNLATRRGLHSAHHLSLSHRAQIQAARRHNESILDQLVRNTREERLDDSQDETIDFSLDDFVSSLDNYNHNNSYNNSSSSSSNASRSNGGGLIVDVGVSRNNNASHNDNDNSNNNNVPLDNVIRINWLRQISQQQEGRVMRSSRHHRSTGHSSSGRSSRTTSNVERRRDNLIQRGIDIPPSSSSSSSTVRHPASQLPEPTLLYPNEHHTTPFPPMPRLSSLHHIRRGLNLSNDPRSQPPIHRSSFVDDFYSEVPHSYDDDHHHMSRILSPVPMRYDARLTSLPVGNEHDLLDTHDIDIHNRSSNLDRVSNGNDSVRTEQRGSASGEVC